MRISIVRWPVWVLAAPLCLGLVALSSGASAADPAAPAPDQAASGGATWWENPEGALEHAVLAVGSGAVSLWSTATSPFTQSKPIDVLPAQLSDEDRRFFAVFDTMGLKLAEIKIGGSLFSSDTYRLVADREPSDADLDRAERALAQYQVTSGGMRSWARERVIRTVLDLASDKGFVVSAVNISLSPWPSVSYELNARGRPLEAGERRITQKLQGQ